MYFIDYILPTIIVIPRDKVKNEINDECLFNPIEVRLYQFSLVWFWENVNMKISSSPNEVKVVCFDIETGVDSDYCNVRTCEP